MPGETFNDKRNFGTEIRQVSGDRHEQKRLLREMVMTSGGVDEDSARRVFDAFDDAGLVIVTEEGWQNGLDASASLQRLGNFADRLYSDES